MLKTLLNPISEMQQMVDFMDRAFNSVWPETTGARSASESVLTLPVDVWEKDNRYFIRAAVPGMKPDELDIQVQNGTLLLSGETKHEVESDREAKFWRREYRYGQFRRTIRLPENVKTEEIEASFENGYVTVTVPMQPEVHKSLKVPIRSRAQQGQSALEQSTGGRNGESAAGKSKETASVS